VENNKFSSRLRTCKNGQSYLRCSNRRHFKFAMPIDHSKSQPTAYGRQTVPEMGVVTSRNPL